MECGAGEWWHRMARSTSNPNAALDLCQLLASSMLPAVRCQTAGSEVRTGLCMTRGRLKKWQLSKLSLQHRTERFGWAVHNSVCFAQDAFFYQARGVVQEPFKGAFLGRSFCTSTWHSRIAARHYISYRIVKTFFIAWKVALRHNIVK